jgi:hypothetical protein
MWGWSTLDIDERTLQWKHKRWSNGEVVDSVVLAK